MTTPTATDTHPITARPNASKLATRPDARNAAARLGADRIAAAGTLTVYVPHSTWSYLTGGHRDDLASLAARVREHIRCSLVPEANKIMSGMCPDAGTQFTPDPFMPGRDVDRHGFAVHGRLTVYAPRTWGDMFIDADHPRPPSDDEIATD